LGTLIAEVVCIGIYGPFAFSLGTELPKWLFIWPQVQQQQQQQQQQLKSFHCPTKHLIY
jgi:hypothetical protein